MTDTKQNNDYENSKWNFFKQIQKEIMMKRRQLLNVMLGYMIFFCLGFLDGVFYANGTLRIIVIFFAWITILTLWILLTKMSIKKENLFLQVTKEYAEKKDKSKREDKKEEKKT